MIVVGLNKTDVRLRRFLNKWVPSVYAALKKRRIQLPNDPLLVIAFVSTQKMKKLNMTFRKKDYATDVLSFEPLQKENPDELGELVLCLSTLRRQAKEHKLSLERECGYMVLHGVLHLLGYEHETNNKDAQEMFKIQDDVFEELCRNSSHVSNSRNIRTQKKFAKKPRSRK